MNCRLPLMTGCSTISRLRYGLFRRQGGLYFQERDRNHNGDVKISRNQILSVWFRPFSVVDSQADLM